MPLLTGFAWSLICQSAGEVLVHVSGLPLPGPVAMGIAEQIGGIPALAAVFVCWRRC